MIEVNLNFLKRKPRGIVRKLLVFLLSLCSSAAWAGEIKFCIESRTDCQDIVTICSKEYVSPVFKNDYCDAKIIETLSEFKKVFKSSVNVYVSNINNFSVKDCGTSSYDAVNNTITLNRNGRCGKKMNAIFTLFHELGHHIQINKNLWCNGGFNFLGFEMTLIFEILSHGHTHDTIYLSSGEAGVLNTFIESWASGFAYYYIKEIYGRENLEKFDSDSFDFLTKKRHLPWTATRNKNESLSTEDLTNLAMTVGIDRYIQGLCLNLNDTKKFVAALKEGQDLKENCEITNNLEF